MMNRLYSSWNNALDYSRYPRGNTAPTVLPYMHYRYRGSTVQSVPSPRCYREILPIPTVITAVTAVLPHSPLPCHSLFGLPVSPWHCAVHRTACLAMLSSFLPACIYSSIFFSDSWPVSCSTELVVVYKSVHKYCRQLLGASLSVVNSLCSLIIILADRPLISAGERAVARMWPPRYLHTRS